MNVMIVTSSWSNHLLIRQDTRGEAVTFSNSFIQVHTATVAYGRTSEGRLWLWGDNSYGQLGVEPSNTSSVGESKLHAPLGPAQGVVVQRMALGEHHTYAITNASELFSFGYNERHQLGRCNGHVTIIHVTPPAWAGATAMSRSCDATSLGGSNGHVTIM